jgi:hypothetical protein
MALYRSRRDEPGAIATTAVRSLNASPMSPGPNSWAHFHPPELCGTCLSRIAFPGQPYDLLAHSETDEAHDSWWSSSKLSLLFLTVFGTGNVRRPLRATDKMPALTLQVPARWQ